MNYARFSKTMSVHSVCWRREVQERQQAAPFSIATGGANCLPRSVARAASTSAAHYYCCPLATINHAYKRINSFIYIDR